MSYNYSSALYFKENPHTCWIVFNHVPPIRAWLNILLPFPWLDFINPITLFNLFLVYYFIQFNSFKYAWLRLFFPSPPHERWRKKPPITSRRILLVRHRPHAKYTRMVYPYIHGSGRYVNPSWAKPL